MVYYYWVQMYQCVVSAYIEFMYGVLRLTLLFLPKKLKFLNKSVNWLWKSILSIKERQGNSTPPHPTGGKYCQKKQESYPDLNSLSLLYSIWCSKGTFFFHFLHCSLNYFIVLILKLNTTKWHSNPHIFKRSFKKLL